MAVRLEAHRRDNRLLQAVAVAEMSAQRPV
jgi:hypothetical protein